MLNDSMDCSSRAVCIGGNYASQLRTAARSYVTARVSVNLD
jgi:ornithine cyclodeaminase/alanine dehydrogenase-like protein (mu-crystallin family)